MPTIIVQANQADGDADRVTFSQRVTATHLQDEHYAAQLIERLARATIDAELLESPTDGADRHDRYVSVPRHGLPPPGRRHASGQRRTTVRQIAIRPAVERRRSPPRPDATDAPGGERDREQAAALWLYAWSHEALRPTGELLAERLTTPTALRPGKRIGRLSARRPRQLNSRSA